MVEYGSDGLDLVSDLTVRSGLFPFLAAFLLLLVVGELARLACTVLGLV